MKTTFSFAVALRRVFDSVSPGRHTAFASEGRSLLPFKKPDGLYAFTEDLPQKLCVRCGGYLPAVLFPQRGQVHCLAVFPATGFAPPPGWKSVPAQAEPGRVLALPDPGYSIRVTGSGAEGVRLRARPGFTGGCLLWSREKRRLLSLVLEKQPPDCYVLDRMPPDPEAGWKVERVYPGMADENGHCALVVPADFEIDMKHCGEAIEWDMR